MKVAVRETIRDQGGGGGSNLTQRVFSAESVIIYKLLPLVCNQGEDQPQSVAGSGQRTPSCDCIISYIRAHQAVTVSLVTSGHTKL